jgi:hypothetical protein
MADQRVYARTFSQTLTLVAGLFCLEKRVSYRRLRKEFDLDDEILNDRRADIGFPGSRLRTLSRPWIGTLYGPPEVAGDQMVAAMDAVGVDGAILASPSACIATTGQLHPNVFAAHPSRLSRSSRPIRPTPRSTCSGHDPFCNRIVAVKLSSS